MKKIIVTLAVALSTMCSFAGEVKVSSKVLDAFKREFASAIDVNWTASRDFYKATFVFNNQQVCAFYSTEGEMMGLTRISLHWTCRSNCRPVLKKIIAITGSLTYLKYQILMELVTISLWKTPTQRLY